MFASYYGKLISKIAKPFVVPLLNTPVGTESAFVALFLKYPSLPPV
jgi:hypothetical protein